MGTRRIACAALLIVVLPATAMAQATYPQPTPQAYPRPAPQAYPQPVPSPTPPAGAAANPVCGRLEAQLAAIDRGAGADPARAEQTRRIEDTLSKQQADLDRTQAQWQRLGCQTPSLFSIFANQSPQCAPLSNQIGQMRAGIDRTMAELQRSRHGADDEMQRQAVIGALAQNSCGPQYTAAAPQRGFFETLFGGLSNPGGTAPPMEPQLGGSGYRTLCVRSCDGYYFPISFATSPARFAEDEETCQRLCPATEAMLYTHRNPGEDVTQAASSSGRVYKDLPNAFRYRREFVASCSCKQPGQTWAEALGQTKDSTVERGDIVVTEERAKALSQPRPENPNRSTPRPDARKPTANMPLAAPSDAGDPAAPAADPGKRTVRTVGPTFIPAH